MVEDEKTTGSAANKHISENRNKNIGEWSSYNSGHLVYSGATMAEGNQTTTFDQSYKTFRYGAEKCENVKCLKNLEVVQWSKSLSHLQSNDSIKIKNPPTQTSANLQ